MRPVSLILVSGLLALAAFLGGSGDAQAQPWRRQVLPLDQILPGIRRLYPGQFYDADGPTPGPGGSQHYHLKWMTPDGRIEWLDADAHTGRVLGKSPGRDRFDRPGAGFAPPPPFPPPGFEARRMPPEVRPWRGGPRDGYDRGPGWRRGR